MEKVNKDYPNEYYDVQPLPDNEGFVIGSFSYRDHLAAIKQAYKEGYDINLDSHRTVRYDNNFYFEITKPQEKKEEKVEEVVKVEVKEEEPTESEKEKKEISFQVYRALENNKANRAFIDKLARDRGINIDRRKFRTVEAITDEFERLYDDV